MPYWRVVTQATYFPPVVGRGAASSVTSTFTELPSSVALKKYLKCPFLPKAALNSANVGPCGPLQGRTWLCHATHTSSYWGM